MLHVIDGTWRPNKDDQRRRLEPGFGATIMIINGGIECGHGSEKPQALHRQAYYRKFAEYFKVTSLLHSWIFRPILQKIDFSKERFFVFTR